MSENDENMPISGAIKAGDQGQFVVVAETPKDFIKPGDLLLVVAGKNRYGITMVKADAMRKPASRVLRDLHQTAD